MSRVPTVKFAARKSGHAPTRPFIERAPSVNDYIAERFDLGDYGFELTDDVPDYLVILNRLNYEIDHPVERTIGVVNEPSWSANVRPDYLERHCALVLSHFPEAFKNGVYAHSLSIPWLTRDEAASAATKKRKLSLIASPLQMQQDGTNYRFRHELVKAILESDLECDIYGDWPGDDPRLQGFVESKADALNGYEFSVVIENTCEPGYATEKLLDCFLSGTQPIYLGDPLAGRHFGEDAVVPLDASDPIGQLKSIVDGDISYRPGAIEFARLRYQASHSLMRTVEWHLLPLERMKPFISLPAYTSTRDDALAEMEAKNRRLRKQLDRGRKALEDERINRTEILQSRSWQWTAPLRIVAAKLEKVTQWLTGQFRSG